MSALTSAFAADITADGGFDTEKEMFFAEGTIKEAQNSPVTMIVVHSDTDSNSISKSLADEQKMIAGMAAADKDGNFRFETGLPTFWRGGLYKAIINYGSQSTEVWFTYSKPSLSKAAEKINGADIAQTAQIIKENAAVIGAEEKHISAYLNEISKYVFGNRPKEGYSAAGLAESYTKALVLSQLRDGTENIDNTIRRYSYTLGINAEEEYFKYSDRVKNELDRLMKKNSENISFEKLYGKCLLLARINKPDSNISMRETVTENASEIGISLTKYNGLGNEYKKNKVFSIMMQQQYEDYPEVIKKFNEACDEVAAETENNGSGSSGGGGGSSSSSGKSVTGAVITGNLTPEQNNRETFLQEFSDINGHWAYDSIVRLSREGTVDGFEDKTFRPDAAISRAEFAKIVCLMKKIDLPEYTGIFSDISASNWCCKYVQALSDRKIITGFDGKFMPEDKITRQDAAVMLARAWELDTSAVKESNVFADRKDIADYAQPAVNLLSDMGIINGYDGYFNPKGTATRAQTAAMLCRMEDFGK